jgi:hypothetical protein
MLSTRKIRFQLKDGVKNIKAVLIAVSPKALVKKLIVQAKRKIMDELAAIKRLAGITEFNGLQPYGGSNISITGMTNQALERKHNIKPGTDEWFKLWFSKPYLTGEKKING